MGKVDIKDPGNTCGLSLRKSVWSLVLGDNTYTLGFSWLDSGWNRHSIWEYIDMADKDQEKETRDFNPTFASVV
jgi:hypothetical protein